MNRLEKTPCRPDEAGKRKISAENFRGFRGAIHEAAFYSSYRGSSFGVTASIMIFFGLPS